MQADTNVLPNGGRHLMPMIRVACITPGGDSLIVAAAELAQHLESMDDNKGDIEGDANTFTLTFKTMLVRDFEALEEFDGF